MKSPQEGKSLKSAIFGRLLILLLVAFAWAIAILCRLVYLQGFKTEEFRVQADGQQWGYIELSSKRGDILDRQLEDLAISIRADSVYAHPYNVKDTQKAAHRLAPVLGMSSKVLLKKLQSDQPFVYLKRKIPPRQAKEVLEMGIEGIEVQEETKRVYPNKELASHVIGFVGMDNGGLAGLEYYYNQQLSGEKGRIDLRFDARRNSYHRRPTREQRDGNVLVLTIDRTIQHVAESELKKAVIEKGATSGSAIVMNPQSGEILAMASYPTFNPNIYQQAPAETHRNRAILDLYEPGSTFKVVTLSALLNEGLSHPLELIDCRAGTARLAGKVYKEAKRNFEFLTLEDVVAKSSNIGTVKLALRLGEERLHDYVRAFGFGERTGIDLPGEEIGLFRPVSQWSRISIGAISIGQEVGVTPLQMIRGAAVLANGGHLVEPFLVKRVVAPTGETILERQPKQVQILSQKTATTARSILRHVVETGTGRTAKPVGYSAGGKTGTAQMIVDGRYSKSKYVASFIGFAPASDPALITLVVVREPKGIPYGGHVAGPAFKEIMERSLIHLRVPQDQPREVPDNKQLMAKNNHRPQGVQAAPPEPPLEDTEEPLAEGELQEALLSLLDNSGRQRSVTVELSSIKLPDFTGKNLREVAQQCAQLQLKLKITGSGVAVGQRPTPGSRISKGMVCEVFFSPEGQHLDATEKLAFRRTGAVPAGNEGRR